MDASPHYLPNEGQWLLHSDSILFNRADIAYLHATDKQELILSW